MAKESSGNDSDLDLDVDLEFYSDYEDDLVWVFEGEIGDDYACREQAAQITWWMCNLAVLSQSTKRKMGNQIRPLQWG